jgi:hypothetical protein
MRSQPPADRNQATPPQAPYRRPSDGIPDDDDFAPSEGLPRWQLWLLIALVSLVVIVLGMFILGLGFAVWGDGPRTAAIFQIIRDVMLITLSLQITVVIVAFAIFIAQLARLIHLLNTEFRPLMGSLQASAKEVLATAQFTGEQVRGPLVTISGFVVALITLIRELTRLNNAVRRSGTSVVSEALQSAASASVAPNTAPPSADAQTPKQ